MLASQGQLTAAVTAYGESVEADPGFADGWYNLGNVLLGMGRYSEAEAPLRRTNPNPNPILTLNLTLTLTLTLSSP